MSKKNRQHRKNRKPGMSPGTLVYTGDRDHSPSSILSVSYSEETYEETGSYVGVIEDKIQWIDIRGLTDTTLIERIGIDFQIHPLALEDVLNTDQRAKLDEYENGLFFILRNLKMDVSSNEFESEQIALFCGKNYVISFQEDPDDTLDAVRQRAREGLGRIRKKGADYLMYALVDNLVDNYYIVLDCIESNILDIEEALHHNGAQISTKDKMFHLKRVINEFKHRVLPLKEAVTRFQRTESNIVDDSNRLYFRDVVDHVDQILDGIDNQRNMLSNMEALYHAEASNRLNNVMRLLTVISTIFIPLSFIVGLYGMNFDNMPELHTSNGYFILLGVMFCLMVTMMVYFKTKKWI